MKKNQITIVKEEKVNLSFNLKFEWKDIDEDSPIPFTQMQCYYEGMPGGFSIKGDDDFGYILENTLTKQPVQTFKKIESAKIAAEILVGLE